MVETAVYLVHEDVGTHANSDHHRSYHTSPLVR